MQEHGQRAGTGTVHIKQIHIHAKLSGILHKKIRLLPVLFTVINTGISSLIIINVLPATINVNSNPFLTDFLWTWLGRLANPT
jgi:hypothetical protein